MLQMLRRNWWMFAIRGVAGVAFGLASLFLPGLTLIMLVALFGAYAIVDGVFALITAIRHRSGLDSKRTSMLVLEGIAGIAAGVIAWAWPGITTIALVFLIAVWAIATGAFEIATAIRLRREIEGEWLLATAGVASVVFGLLLGLRPAAGAFALVWLIASYAIAFGALLIGAGLWLRFGHAHPGQHAHV